MLAIEWMKPSHGGRETMDGDTTADVSDLIDRLRQGDDSARKALLDRVAHRLHRIASSMLRKEFPRLRAHHDTESVVNETWMRLTKALEGYQPQSAAEFYGLMFHKARQVLLDMARRQTRHDEHFEGTANAGDASESTDPTRTDPSETTHDPARLAVWTEFHQQVEGLPEDERLVFGFHYFAEVSQAEIARLLNLTPKQVSRLWLAARFRLGRWLRDVGVENPTA